MSTELYMCVHTEIPEHALTFTDSFTSQLAMTNMGVPCKGDMRSQSVDRAFTQLSCRPTTESGKSIDGRTLSTEMPTHSRKDHAPGEKI